MSNPKPSRWQRQLSNILETQLARSPLLLQLRAVGNQLLDERANWILVLPAALILFLLTYRSERQRVKALLRDLAD